MSRGMQYFFCDSALYVVIVVLVKDAWLTLPTNQLRMFGLRVLDLHPYSHGIAENLIICQRKHLK